MRKFYFIIACMFCAGLAAGTTGSVEFHFPPSADDWILLTDTSAYCPPEKGDEMPFNVKIYTHKAGDALEFFIMASTFDEDDEDEDTEDEPFQTAEYAQLFINDLLRVYFPNHRIAIANLKETSNEGFLEWELNDGVQQVFHG